MAGGKLGGREAGEGELGNERIEEVDVAEVEMKKCNACGAETVASSTVCAFCGNQFARTSYEASVDAGLRRLEQEKLAFLKGEGVISKFDPENLTAFAPSPLDELVDEDGDEETVVTVDGALIDDTVSDREELLGALGSEVNESAQLSAVGKLVADEVETLSRENADGPTVRKPTCVTLDFAALRSYESGEVKLGVAKKPAAGSVSHASGSAVLEKTEDDSIQLLSPSSVEVAAPSESELQVMEDTSCHDQATRPRAAILKMASVRRRASSRGRASLPAIEKLKNDGVFDTVCHSEVSQSIERTLDEILPKSVIRPWTGDVSEFESVGSNLEPALDVEDSEYEDLTSRQDSPRPGAEGEDLTSRQDSPRPGAEGEDLMSRQDSPRPGAEGREVRPSQASPQVLPTAHAHDTDLDSRETIPINLKEHPLPDEWTRPRRKKKPIVEDFAVVATENQRASGNGWIVVIVLLCAGIVWMLMKMHIIPTFWEDMDGAPSTPAVSIFGAKELAPDEVRQAVNAARETVSDVVANSAWVEAWIAARLEAEPDGVLLAMGTEMFPDNAHFAALRIQSMIDAGDFVSARAALRAVPPGYFLGDEDGQEWRALRVRAFEADPVFLPPTQTITPERCDVISPLGGGSTLTFVFQKDGQRIGAFKPFQTRRQSNYRAEIAAWRLCVLLECDFKIPWNRPVKIEKSVFHTLYNKSKSRKRESYRKELVDMIWTAEDGRPYVYGTLKDWVPDFTRFPIEMTSMWQPWLSQNAFIETFPDFKTAIAPLRRPKHTEKIYAELIQQSPRADARFLATQVSQILTFDYLIGNWDRFSGVKDWWGVNCQYKDDHIVSIDNGASFPSYANDKVIERFMAVERFSAHFIEALRRLDKDETLYMLFPNPSEAERRSFDQFWKQRAHVLSRVDKLAEIHGMERVLSFD